MKKGLFISALCVLFCMSAAHAQMERPRPLELGLYVAPTINWFSSTEQFDNKGICLGGSYGLNVEINLFRTASNYYFHTGVNIHQFGGKLQYAKAIDSTNNRLAIDKHSITYVSIPTAIKLATNPVLNDRLMIFGVFGLDNALRVSSSVKKDKDYNTKKTVKNNDNTALFKESLLITIGGEYVISGNTRVTAGLNFNFGFTNAFQKEFTQDEPIQARTLGLQIGLIF